MSSKKTNPPLDPAYLLWRDLANLVVPQTGQEDLFLRGKWLAWGPLVRPGCALRVETGTDGRSHFVSVYEDGPVHDGGGLRCMIVSARQDTAARVAAFIRDLLDGKVDRTS